MSKRNYNVFFNTHTVSGIVISVALYIIFFAGAFALFKDEIQVWEEGKRVSNTDRHAIDFDTIFKSLDDEFDLQGRDIQIDLGKKEDKIYAYLLPSQDSLASEKSKTTQFFSVDINTLERKEYHEYYGIGEFLYRLHFFHQIPVIGVYIAGFVAFFFLFAIVTGVIIHWKKILSNFYSFNPKVALKRVWTDAHTALGVIGLPFQFIFAVTGAYFCLSILVLIPANFLYQGDQAKLMEDIRPEQKVYEWKGKTTENIQSFNALIQQSNTYWNDYEFTHAFVKNYGGNNMKYILQGELKNEVSFIGNGFIIFDAISGEVETKQSPHKLNYIKDTQTLMTRLHFATFGGFMMKFVYFTLAFITCFVIITGVLIWIEARNKKSMTLEKRLFTLNVGHVYLSICLSMLPVTAISFVFVKLFGNYFTNTQSAIYGFYFILWLTFIFYMRFKRDNYFVNKMSLLVGGIAALLIPISSGIVSGNWIWKTIEQQQYEILTVDVLWIFIGVTSLLIHSKITKEVKKESAFTKNPIDHKEFQKNIIEEKLKNQSKQNIKNKNYIPMRTKIIMLWTLLVIGFILHHVYGIANVYFKESLLMEGATGETPSWVHPWRIGLEGLAFLFAVLTVQLSKSWFKWTSLIWSIILGLFNIYHFITAIIYEPSNISEILILLLMAVANAFLVKEISDWKKVVEVGE
ncbi:PepSY-associated TM helix domain-containing protein [Tenacibaculum sp. M341]|uniref:PepSY-associated TM helix domain-containing protein n=1 Tax=Tenacibaculum sp. M341 TaxID=2530339 RepID=UPI001052C224|nr:PepSY-associated TM helix domain-containing protein [Tenacibaculum sp. M341]TCI90368.1 PepSY domain-containing protein [Tenacibaculum sp. M341]